MKNYIFLLLFLSTMTHKVVGQSYYFGITNGWGFNGTDILKSSNKDLWPIPPTEEPSTPLLGFIIKRETAHSVIESGLSFYTFSAGTSWDDKVENDDFLGIESVNTFDYGYFPLSFRRKYKLFSSMSISFGAELNYTWFRSSAFIESSGVCFSTPSGTLSCTNNDATIKSKNLLGGGVNLGLDFYLLKSWNIFLTAKKNWRIGEGNHIKGHTTVVDKLTGKLLSEYTTIIKPSLHDFTINVGVAYKF